MGAAAFAVVISSVAGEACSTSPGGGCSLALVTRLDLPNGAGDCTIELRRDARIATYDFPTGISGVGTRAADGSCASQGFFKGECGVLRGPKPGGCGRSTCGLYLIFYEPESLALRDYLGGIDFERTVTCGGKVVRVEADKIGVVCPM